MKVAVFGLPASGKRTICEKMSKKYKLKHILSGDISRNYFANNANASTNVKKIWRAILTKDDLL